MERRTKQNIEPIYPKTEIEEPKKNVGFSKNKQLCEDITRGSCLRPDIFLKNRDCDDCYLNKCCIAPNKIFSKDKKRKK
jgi:hypothetical protein